MNHCTKPLWFEAKLCTIVFWPIPFQRRRLLNSRSMPVEGTHESPSHAHHRHRISSSPSFDMHLTQPDWTSNGANNEYRPDSATSSVRSQDSGVAQSDPKTSHDFSAKSEPSSKVSHPNVASVNHVLSNNYPPALTRHRLTPSNSNQHLSMPPQHVFDAPAEHVRDKLQSLNTQRLKVLRQATKSFIVSRVIFVPLDGAPSTSR